MATKILILSFSSLLFVPTVINNTMMALWIISSPKILVSALYNMNPLTRVYFHASSSLQSLLPVDQKQYFSTAYISSLLCKAVGGRRKGGDKEYDDDSNSSMSNSERERREENQRRKQRQGDVVIGKTSARRDEKDYAIDPKATEEQFLRSLTNLEQLVYRYTEDGLDAMKLLRLKDADRYFDKVFELKPDAYLWQAGIVKFYLNDLVGAANVFARNAVQYEKKFGPMGVSPASEERIWRDATELKHIHNYKKKKDRKRYYEEKAASKRQNFKSKRKNEAQANSTSPTFMIIPQIQEDEELVIEQKETRRVLKLAKDLFDASIDQNFSVEALSLAQLLSIAGNDDVDSLKQRQRHDLISSPKMTTVPDAKKRKLNAWFYLGLYYDVTGDVDESKRCMKNAFKLTGLTAGKSTDIMATLPLLHITVRDWFDDDPYEEDDNEENHFYQDDSVNNKQTRASLDKSTRIDVEYKVGTELDSSSIVADDINHLSDAYSNPVLEASIVESVEKLKFHELRDALMIRGLSSIGSKNVLKNRLFISLMDDAGYQSGFTP